MDIFNQKRMMFGIISVLILLNLTELGTLWFQKRKPPRNKGEKKIEHFLKDELQLSADQMATFERLRKAHFQKARQLDNKAFQLREKVTKSLFESSPDSAKLDSMATQIGELQGELERLRFYHFQDLKALCTPGQRKKFEGLMEELIRSMRPPGRRGGPPGRRGGRGGPPHRRSPGGR